MKHLAKIQSEFLRNWWASLSLNQQNRYLALHPKSKRKLTNTIINQNYLAKDITKRYKALTPKILRHRNDLEYIIYLLDSVSENDPSLPKIQFAFFPAQRDGLNASRTGGQYDPISDHITIHMGELPKDKIEAEIDLAARFRMIEHSLAHELIHREQYLRMKTKSKDYDKTLLSEIDRRRNWSDDKEKQHAQYLADPKEIVTHANDAVNEFREDYTYAQILDIIRHASSFETPYHSPTFWDYQETFGTNHPIFKKFLQAMYRYTTK
jgi:hypothetical protein